MVRGAPTQGECEAVENVNVSAPTMLQTRTVSRKDVNASAPTLSQVQTTYYYYRGCYEDNSNRKLPINGYWHGADRSLCFHRCKGQEPGYNKLFGLEYGQECWCGGGSLENMGAKKPDAECNMDCRTNHRFPHKCGGSWRMSVYGITSWCDYSKGMDCMNI